MPKARQIGLSTFAAFAQAWLTLLSVVTTHETRYGNPAHIQNGLNLMPKKERPYSTTTFGLLQTYGSKYACSIAYLLPITYRPGVNTCISAYLGT